MGGCSSNLRDIEDLASTSLREAGAQGAPSVSSADEDWVLKLRREPGVAPLYTSKDLRSVHLELTTHCNAACPQCLRNDYGGKENKLLAQHHAELKVADVRKLLPPWLLRQLDKVYLCGNYGDPAVASDCLEVLRYLRSVKGGPKVGLFTNGGMRRPEWWVEVAKVMQPAKEAFVRFAIDGDESTNHLYRQGVLWDRLLANVKAFLAAGGNAEWDFIVFSHNEHQVEAMRSMAEELGFTRFMAKKTSRFLDKKRGISLPGTPVKDLSGTVVRHLRPPSAAEWQNIAAVHDAQRVLASHGSMDAYYDTCEVRCKVAQEKEIYISAEGLALPCCWLAGELYNERLSDQNRQLARLLQAAEPGRGVAAQSALGRGGLAAVVDRRGGLFDKLVHAAMKQPSVAEGRLRTCSAVCGTQMSAFAKQFDGGRKAIDPSRRVEVALRAEQPATKAAVGPEAPSRAPVLIWYGTETGNAEALARRAGEALGAAAEVSPPPSSEPEITAALQGRAALVLILATWGDGEPTDDARPFMAWLERRVQEAGGKAWAAGIPAAVYGVGSSLWAKFNAVARKASKLLAAAGAPALAVPGESDAATGDLQTPFGVWLEQECLPALSSLGVDPQAGAPSVSGELRSASAEAVVGRVRRWQRLAPEDPVALYVELELAVPLECSPADAIGILPPVLASSGQPRATPRAGVRWYTTSSLPKRSGENAVVSLTVREVIGGVCSPWLCSLQEGAEVLCLPPRGQSHIMMTWRKASEAADVAPPLLLVAAGAGVAPFMALLEFLQGMAVRPKCILWMGCRQASALPHGERLAELLQDGTLQRLALAESRPSGAGLAERRLVQDVLATDAEEVASVLFPDPASPGPPGLMLVCGAAAMGAAVREVVRSIAMARRHSVEALQLEGRYAEELWG